MTSFVKQVTSVILKSDIILLVLDARAPEETRHRRVEKIIESRGKRLIYVINKSDLVDTKKLARYSRKFHPCVFISTTKRRGIRMLRDRILIEANRIGDGKPLSVGVVGYPNVGKSSLINILAGRNAAPTSSIAGTTKSVRKVRFMKNLMLVDSPGIIQSRDKDEEMHAAIGSVEFSKVKDPESAAFRLMESRPGLIERFYEVERSSDKDEVLEKIAQKRNLLKKGGFPDSERAARLILKDWQNGTIIKRFR